MEFKMTSLEFFRLSNENIASNYLNYENFSQILYTLTELFS